MSHEVCLRNAKALNLVQRKQEKELQNASELIKKLQAQIVELEKKVQMTQKLAVRNIGRGATA